MGGECHADRGSPFPSVMRSGVPCGLGKPFFSSDEEVALQGGFVSLGKANPSQDNYLVQRYGCFERKVVSLTTLKILAFGNKN